jgi:hypothetical protein
MAVVEDGEMVALLPHRASAGLAERVPRLTGSHAEVLGIVVGVGAATRRRIDELRRSTPPRPSLPSWWSGRWSAAKGPRGRAPFYRGTANLDIDRLKALAKEIPCLGELFTTVWDHSST